MTKIYTVSTGDYEDHVFRTSPFGFHRISNHARESYFITGWFESEEQAIRVAKGMLEKHKMDDKM